MTELMPHAITSDSYLHPWPQAKVAQRTLPLPSSTYEMYSKAPSYTSRAPTPPPSHSGVHGVRPLPYMGQQSQETGHSVRSYGPGNQSTKRTHGSGPVSLTTSNYHKSSPTPISALAQAEPEERRSPSNSNTLTPAFKLPSTIKAPQATLPQLAAEITCLFWFENITTLKQIESYTPGSLVAHISLSPLSTPTSSFRKWVVTLLATTQVTPNVILLALFFIYKLKGYNPTVRGGPNSEYKLLTVALMLGNKFLDDNTYTNKTWAEVSGMSVHDMHVMEVEFLSNMRYSLFTSEKTWNSWHKKLGTMGTFIDTASKAKEAAAALRPTLLTPSSSNYVASLPSPPNPYQHSPPCQSNYSPHLLPRSNTPILLPQPGSNAISPIGPLPELDPRFGGRKRSHDDGLQEPPAKRPVPANYQNTLPSLSSTLSTYPQMVHPQPLQPRVNLPSLGLSSISQPPHLQLQTQLPIPGSRAMSMVYQPPNLALMQPSQPTSIPPLQLTGLPQPNVLQSDHARQLSPFPMNSATSSPINAAYTPTSQNTSRLSPSYFLAQRSSPYRPVRQVQTLLQPPSSTPLYNAPRMITHDQMQYHPLGRPYSERRVGHLPYLNHDAWPQSHQFNQWNETPLPQPNFHA